MSYLQRQYNQVCIIVNYMIKLRCSVHEVFNKKFFNFRLNSCTVLLNNKCKRLLILQLVVVNKDLNFLLFLPK